jgi:hypothetical protein
VTVQQVARSAVRPGGAALKMFLIKPSMGVCQQGAVSMNGAVQGVPSGTGFFRRFKNALLPRGLLRG